MCRRDWGIVEAEHRWQPQMHHTQQRAGGLTYRRRRRPPASPAAARQGRPRSGSCQGLHSGQSSAQEVLRSAWISMVQRLKHVPIHMHVWNSSNGTTMRQSQGAARLTSVHRRVVLPLLGGRPRVPSTRALELGLLRAPVAAPQGRGCRAACSSSARAGGGGEGVGGASRPRAPLCRWAAHRTGSQQQVSGVRGVTHLLPCRRRPLAGGAAWGAGGGRDPAVAVARVAWAPPRGRDPARGPPVGGQAGRGRQGRRGSTRVTSGGVYGRDHCE